MVEKLGLPLLHRTADVAVGDQTYNLVVHLCDAQSKLSLAHEDDSLAQVHLRRQYGKVFLEHHVLSRCQQSFAEFTTWVELCEVTRLEVAFFH